MKQIKKFSQSSTEWAVRILPTGNQLSAAQLKARATQVAHLLQSKNVKRVAILSENRLEIPELMLGARWAGTDYVISGTDYLLTGVRLSHDSLLGILQDFNPSMIIISDTHSEIAQWLRAKLPQNTHCLMIGSTIIGWGSYERIRAQQVDDPLNNPGKGEFYPISGGSTGRPKVIKTPMRVDGKPSPIQNIMTTDPDGIVLVTGPLYHNLHARALLAALLCETKVAILEHWDSELFLKAIDNFRITQTTIIPTMMARLLQISPTKRKSFNLISLKKVFHTAGPCPYDVKRKFISWFGEHLYEIYGMTERFGGTVISASEWLTHPGSVGRPFPGCRIVIRDKTGKVLPPSEVGVIWFSQEYTYTRMEYLNNLKASMDCYNKHGEATVRDLGYVDAEGFLYITGRAKRMAVVGGVNVYPEATENLLSGQPEVLDVWAFAAPDRLFGEKLSAFVQLQPGVKQSNKFATRLLTLCEENLGQYATPTKIIFVDMLPRNEAGKMEHERITAMIQKINVSNNHDK